MWLFPIFAFCSASDDELGEAVSQAIFLKVQDCEKC